jgi:Transglutaminase-like superfamily
MDVSRRILNLTIYAGAICVCRVMLIVISLGRVVAISRRWARAPKTVTQEVDHVAVLRDISLAAALMPIRARCLEQSLVGFVALRRRGVPVDLRLGVQPYGFVAHAWIELGGRPLNQRSELIRKLVPFPGSLA